MITAENYFGDKEGEVLVTPELIAKFMREGHALWGAEGEVSLSISRESWEHFLDSIEW